jgi:hypothetical protein
MDISESDILFFQRAIRLALEAEKESNLPIGAWSGLPRTVRPVICAGDGTGEKERSWDVISTLISNVLQAEGMGSPSLCANMSWTTLLWKLV